MPWLSVDAHYSSNILEDITQAGLTFDHEFHNAGSGRHAFLLRGFGGAVRDLHAFSGLFGGPTQDPSFLCFTGGAAAGYGYRIGYFDARILAGARLMFPPRTTPEVFPDVMLSLSFYLPILSADTPPSLLR